MSNRSITPNIEVTIGRQTRLYHAFITTAPAALDAPATLTLYAGPLKDVVGLAMDTVALDAIRAATPSRLVLIDTTEFGWQRARCRSRAHRLTPADPVLVGLNTSQQWLWQRLQAPIAATHGDRRSFLLLRWVAKREALDRLGAALLTAYQHQASGNGEGHDASRWARCPMTFRQTTLPDKRT